MSEHRQVEQGSRESREQRLARILCSVAHTNLDLLMEEKEWRALGLSELYSDIDTSDQFRWTIYVEPAKQEGVKRVGIKLFNSKGLFDAYEIKTSDTTLAPSNAEHQSFIDKEMGKLAEAERERKKQIRDTEVQRAEKERGFPAGTYKLYADFPIRSGGRFREIIGHDFRVGELETRKSVFRRAESDAYMQGLHNYQLDVRLPRHYAIVTLIMQRPGVPDITWQTKINHSGHPPSETDLREHRES